MLFYLILLCSLNTHIFHTPCAKIKYQPGHLKVNQDWGHKIATFNIHKYHKSILSQKSLVNQSGEYDGLSFFEKVAAHHIKV